MEPDGILFFWGAGGIFV